MTSLVIRCIHFRIFVQRNKNSTVKFFEKWYFSVLLMVLQGLGFLEMVVPRVRRVPGKYDASPGRIRSKNFSKILGIFDNLRLWVLQGSRVPGISFEGPRNVQGSWNILSRPLGYLGKISTDFYKILKIPIFRPISDFTSLVVNFPIWWVGWFQLRFLASRWIVIGL